MAIRGMLSKDYLSFIRGQRCVISGKSRVTAHHESVTQKYSGGLKKHFDFGAIPMLHEIHLNERHQWGREEFWRHYRKNPVEIVIKLLEKYIDEGGVDTEMATLALSMVREDNGLWT